MYCPRCEHENLSQARFCMACGAGLSVRCRKCGTELPGEECASITGGAIVSGDIPSCGSEARREPAVAHCHLGLGKLYRRTGKREQAQEHQATATTMYREMGMTYWLKQAEAETGELA